MIEKGGVIFTLIFTMEAILRIIAMGFFKHKNSYLKDPWNWLDFTVVCIGVIELT
jgi:voltage-dependent calcium channel L type alpha-1C/voltage-dependent calcium channel L type alpha-1D